MEETMLSPEYYAFKDIQRSMNRPYIALGVFAVLTATAIAGWSAVQEHGQPALISLGFAVYFLFGTLTIPSTGPVFLASRQDATKVALLLIQEELMRNPALDLVHMRQLADNERKVRSTAAIIYDALGALIEVQP